MEAKKKKGLYIFFSVRIEGTNIISMFLFPVFCYQLSLKPCRLLNSGISQPGIPYFWTMRLTTNFKKTVLFVAFTAILGNCPAQEDVNSVSVKQGTIACDAYYGFPNMLNTFVESAFQQEARRKNYHFRNTGPYGIRVAYFIMDHIGVGIEANYSLTHILWEEGYEYLDEQGHDIKALNYCDYSVSRIRVLGKFSYHFYATKHIDWYVGGGLGINGTHVYFKSDKPDYYFTPDYVTLFTAVPVAAGLNFGGKFYPLKNMGIGLEVGLFGGPPFVASLCTKF